MTRTEKTNPKFNFKGLDHVTFTCSDMARTYDFYHNKLGMPVLHTLEYENAEGDKIGQHFFFGVGDAEAHIAMFYWRDGFQTVPAPQITVRPAQPRANPIGQVGHVNMRVDADDIEQYCKTLKTEGIEFHHICRYYNADNPEILRAVRVDNDYNPPEEGCLMSSVYFNDPDGIRLEFNAWLEPWLDWPNTHEPWAEPSHG